MTLVQTQKDGCRLLLDAWVCVGLECNEHLNRLQRCEQRLINSTPCAIIRTAPSSQARTHIHGIDKTLAQHVIDNLDCGVSKLQIGVLR
eukprot:m.196555 g.196555  ORF g.196555 m.196555 type:complete len:89 (+) comp10632_c0_seq2:1083-1349(+)